MSRGVRLGISPALGVGWSSRCSSHTSIGLSSITRNLNPLLARRQVVVVIPVCLSSRIGSSVTETRVCGNTLVVCGFGVSVRQLCSSRGIKLSKTSIGNGRIGLYWVFGGLDSLGFWGKGWDLCEGGSLEVGI